MAPSLSGSSPTLSYSRERLSFLCGSTLWSQHRPGWSREGHLSFPLPSPAALCSVPGRASAGSPLLTVGTPGLPTGSCVEKTARFAETTCTKQAGVSSLLGEGDFRGDKGSPLEKSFGWAVLTGIVGSGEGPRALGPPVLGPSNRRSCFVLVRPRSEIRAENRGLRQQKLHAH